MANLSAPHKSLVFYSVLYREDLLSFLEIKEQLCLREEEFFKASFNFCPMKEYYSKEMGELSKLKRVFLVKKCLVEKNDLTSIKLATQKIEEDLKDLNGNRIINIDPGLISLENIILSTAKAYSHRIYLDKGVYAELVYQTMANNLGKLPWTYPDYQELRVLDFFNWCRNFLKISIA